MGKEPKEDVGVIRSDLDVMMNFRTALSQPLVVSTEIDQALEDITPKKHFRCKVGSVSTQYRPEYQEHERLLNVVTLSGEFEASGGRVSFYVCFPPNDRSYLDELKRAQNHNFWVTGMMFEGATTQNGYLLYLTVENQT